MYYGIGLPTFQICLFAVGIFYQTTKHIILEDSRLDSSGLAQYPLVGFCGQSNKDSIHVTELLN